MLRKATIFQAHSQGLSLAHMLHMGQLRLVEALPLGAISPQALKRMLSTRPAMPRLLSTSTVRWPRLPV